MSSAMVIFQPVKQKLHGQIKGNQSSNLRQLPTHRLTPPPHLRLLRSIIFIILNKIPQMVLQRLIIRLLLPLQDLHYDRSEALAVEVHFLVVGDLADVAREENDQSGPPE